MASKAGIQISSSLKNKILDPNFKENIEDMLRQKSGGKCFLCGKEFNYATDLIHADHDIPESQNGATDYDNLNLSHEGCNKFKRDNPSLQAKKFLPFRNFLEANPFAKFEDVALNYFKIEFKPIVTIIKGIDAVQLQFPNGTKSRDLTIYEELKPNGRIYKYVFAQVPIETIFNDAVQPRAMKQAHVFKIFQDLHLNPLHEPSSVRLERDLIDGGSNKLLMFDGQHKTVAKMLVSEGASSLIDLKIYLNLSQADANALVNTIQAKIIKLGLTKSEFAAKMGDEFKNEFENYQEYCISNNKEITEEGFINFSDKSKQAHNKKTLMQARINDIIKQEAFDFRILNTVEGISKLKDKKSIIKEATFIGKLIDPLLYNKPLKTPINNDESRILERENIKLILNLFYDHCLHYDESVVTEDELIKIHRLKSQSALNLFIHLVKASYYHLLMSPNDQEILTKKSLEDIKTELEKVVIKFSEHPIWIQFERHSTIVETFYNNLQKNQSLVDVAETMKLKLAYLLGVEKLTGKEVD
jgi:hypothetical protein